MTRSNENAIMKATKRKGDLTVKKTTNYDGYISPWGYVGYSVLWAIPVVGWLLWLFACYSRNTNKKAYARSYVCSFIIAVVLWVVIFVLSVLLTLLGIAVPEVVTEIESFQTMI